MNEREAREPPAVILSLEKSRELLDTYFPNSMPGKDAFMVTYRYHLKAPSLLASVANTSE